MERKVGHLFLERKVGHSGQFLLQVTEVSVEYLSRCIIAQNESSWRYLLSNQDPLILIPAFTRPKSLPPRHHIFVPIGRESSSSESVLKLPRPEKVSFGQALADMRLSEERAYALTKESKRNLLVLRRRLAIAPEIHSPDWAKPENARSLIPVLLAGAWDDTKEADRQVIAELACKPYEEVVSALARWVNASRPKSFVS